MFKTLFMSRAERAAREHLRGYVAGRNHVKSRPENIVFARNISLCMDPFDYGWNRGVQAGLNRYF